jgi:hypothetical protein
LIQWAGDWPPSRQPYSWHAVHELSGDQTGESNSLHILQDYVDSRRISKERFTLSRKRKSPDNDEHLYSLTTFSHLASDSTRSSPVSDLSRDSVTSTEDSDCYNCKLRVENERITISPVCIYTILQGFVINRDSAMTTPSTPPTSQHCQ